MIVGFLGEKSDDYVSIFFVTNEALFLEKIEKKKRYNDVVKVRLIPLCKMRLYLCFVRKREVLPNDLRLRISLV